MPWRTRRLADFRRICPVVVFMSYPNHTEFVLRGGKAIRFVAIAIGHEIDRLTALAEGTQDEDERADASNDLGLYRAILADMGDPR